MFGVVVCGWCFGVLGVGVFGGGWVGCGFWLVVCGVWLLLVVGFVVGLWVVLVCGGWGWSRETVGSVQGVEGFGDLQNFIGKEVEVYAQDKGDGTYTLYGSEGFYLKLK
jgi:hypothetical protein